MAVPFGFSVGDFLVVSKLIGQVAVELRENGEAAPEYQSLLIELEALERALRKLQTLRPAKHELFQLTPIRATALACQRPLQDFLHKISKFESRLGTFNATNNRWKGLPRRMQFRIILKEEVKQLRSALASHVATINLLLITQAVVSISAAEDDRDRLASGLESKILAHRRLLQDINRHVGTSLERHQEIKTQLRDQYSILDELGKKADKTRDQLCSQEASIQGIQTASNYTQERMKSTLATVTEVLALVTSGLMHLRQITKQLHTMIRVCATFTAEMRTAMSKLMELFFSLQTMLQRIDCNLPIRLYLPTVQFTTALGETMALPYQLCQQWATFTELLRVIFLNKPGKSRVDMGKYLIMNACGGRLLEEGSWQHAVKQDDHLSMSIGLDELVARAGSCPFPTCKASTEGVEIENGGRTCRKCGRWSLLTLQKRDELPDELGSQVLGNITRTPVDEENTDSDTDSKSSFDSNHSQLMESKEDIELYRQIHVQYLQSEYRYSQLSLPTSIRLLRLLPCEQDAKTVQCELFEYSIRDSDTVSHPFEALSYVWGSKDKPRSIIIDNQNLSVTQNLYAALLRLRNHTCSRIIWVDAVCIDQTNIKERGSQVLLMAEIYAKASRVIFWLGEAEGDRDRALKIIQTHFSSAAAGACSVTGGAGCIELTRDASLFEYEGRSARGIFAT